MTAKDVISKLVALETLGMRGTVKTIDLSYYIGKLKAYDKTSVLGKKLSILGGLMPKLEKEFPSVYVKIEDDLLELCEI